MRIEHIGDATLYLGDCLEILPTLGKVDCVVTDPPYGIGFNYGGPYVDAGGSAYVELLRPLCGYDLAILQYPEETMKYLVPLFGAPDECFVWAYNSNTARQSRLVSFWGCDVDFSQVRVPPKNPLDIRVSSNVSHYDWCSDIQQVKNISADKTDHPCQAPVALFDRIIRFMPSASTILDPFMGSGTTGVACANLGRKFIGIEINEQYFDIACKRVQKAYDQPDLFVEPPAKAKQEAFDV